MIQVEPRDDTVRAGNHIYKHLLKYETIAVALIITGIVLNLFNRPGRILITFSLLVLALLYFFLVFSTIPYESSGKMERIVYKLAGWLSSIALIGLIFLLNRLPLSATFALVGSIPLLLLVLVMLIMKNRKPENGPINLLTITRSFIIGLLVLIYYLLVHQFY